MDISEMTLPPHIEKIIHDLDTLRHIIIEHKKSTDQLVHQFQGMDKKISKYLHKEIQQLMKKKEKKKPRGFALPTPVSETLCVFMNEPIGTKISRTDATAYMMKYIRDNTLIHPNDSRFILPDETLWNLLGEEARHEEPLDRFNIQKYLNKHFI